MWTVPEFPFHFSWVRRTGLFLTLTFIPCTIFAAGDPPIDLFLPRQGAPMENKAQVITSIQQYNKRFQEQLTTSDGSSEQQTFDEIIAGSCRYVPPSMMPWFRAREKHVKPELLKVAANSESDSQPVAIALLLTLDLPVGYRCLTSIEEPRSGQKDRVGMTFQRLANLKIKIADTPKVPVSAFVWNYLSAESKRQSQKVSPQHLSYLAGVLPDKFVSKQLADLRENRPEAIHPWMVHWASDHEPTLENLKWIDSRWQQIKMSFYQERAHFSILLAPFTKGGEHEAKQIASKLVEDVILNQDTVGLSCAEWSMADYKRFHLTLPTVQKIFRKMRQAPEPGSSMCRFILRCAEKFGSDVDENLRYYLPDKILGPYAALGLGRAYRNQANEDVAELILANLPSADKVEENHLFALAYVGTTKAKTKVADILKKKPDLSSTSLLWVLNDWTIQDILKRFRSRGLMAQLPFDDVISDAFKDSPEIAAREMDWIAFEILAERGNVLFYDEESLADSDCYIEKIKEFAKVSGGQFNPLYIYQNSWKDVAKSDHWTFGFILDNRWYVGTAPNLGDWYSSDTVAKLANKALADSKAPGRFLYVTGYEQYVCYLFGEPKTVEAVCHELGFSFGSGEEARRIGLEFEKKAIEKLLRGM